MLCPNRRFVICCHALIDASSKVREANQGLQAISVAKYILRKEQDSNHGVNRLNNTAGVGRRSVVLKPKPSLSNPQGMFYDETVSGMWKTFLFAT